MRLLVDTSTVVPQASPELEAKTEWAAFANLSPIPVVVFDDERVRYNNQAAADLLGESALHGPVLQVLSESTALVGNDGVVLQRELPLASVDTPRSVSVYLTALPEGRFMAQLTECEAWKAVDRVLSEQQRFRSALLELSELAHSTADDDRFYQRLIERAVEVVPGVQGGSVQLNIPGTTNFRFVAAHGYDLVGLQRHVLQRDHFFRDTWDPNARIVRDFNAESRTPEIDEWLQTVGRLSEIVVNVSAPVLSKGRPVAFLSLDNFEDPDALTETEIEMTTVLARLIGELWARRELEAEVRSEREAFRHLALHDALTGLANRRHIERALGQKLQSLREGGDPYALLFVDIDDFKRVNDDYGHEAGDRLLVKVAEALKSAVRSRDMVGRWGGDEFLILPDRVSSIEEAKAMGDRILASFEDESEGDDRLQTKLSVGIGWSANSDIASDALVRVADRALYEAKEAGKGIFRLLVV